MITDDVIVSVVKKLIGSTMPVGESNHDEEVKNHIGLMINVVDALICSVGNNVCEVACNSSYASIERCEAKMVEGFKMIQEHIEDYLSECEVGGKA